MAAPVLHSFQLLHANYSYIIYSLMGTVYTRLRPLSINRGEIVWTIACWCTQQLSVVQSRDRCPVCVCVFPDWRFAFGSLVGRVVCVCVCPLTGELSTHERFVCIVVMVSTLMLINVL